jgi:hypothetical protein
MTELNLIQETYAEIGIKNIRARGRTVFVRTIPPPQKIGMIWLPPKQAGFYGGLMHRTLVIATVLASGPQCTVKAGERIAFVRQFFSRWKALGGEAFVGWVNENQIAGYWVEGVSCADPKGEGRVAVGVSGQSIPIAQGS